MFTSQNNTVLSSDRKTIPSRGFTLLEILIALFIFAILSLILTSVLRRVIDTHAHTEQVANVMRETEWALLRLSRDIESTVNRPIADTSGKPEATFIGTSNRFEFTHGGFISEEKSSLERTAYEFKEGTLFRYTWEVLDQAPSTTFHERALLTNLMDISFEYLDADKHFHATWPVEPQTLDTLPSAIRINFVYDNGGILSQLYVISAAPPKIINVPPRP